MPQPLLKRGDQGPYVIECQKLLNIVGFELLVDGFFGAVTEDAVKRFQSKAGLIADGIVGPVTWANLGTHANSIHHAFNYNVVDEYMPMKSNQYINEKSNKIGITFHHTVSDGNPASVVRTWDNDSRGAVGTHFVIGREMVNGSKQYDGQVLQCIPLDYWAHHILTTRMGFTSAHNSLVNRSYVGIELCSWGCLKKVGNRFYTIDGRIEIPASPVIILYTPFRTYQYWHKFTPAQINSLYQLTKALKAHLRLDFSKDGKIADWWELSWEAMALRRVLTTHTNFEYGKFDTFPQPEMKAMIEQLYKL